MLQQERKERYCIVAARVIVGRPCEYRAVLLKESQLPSYLDYRGVCRIFSIKEDFEWLRGSSPNFAGLKDTVERLSREVPDDAGAPEVVFIAVRPILHDIDFRRW